MFKRLFVITAALVFLCSSAWAQLLDSPWPKIHKDVKNSGYTSEVGTAVGKIKWRYQSEKPITSSPVLDNNGRVYFGSADKNVYCLDRITGGLIWKYKTGDAIEHSSPAIDASGILYIGSNDSRLYAFDTVTINPANPTPLWAFTTKAGIYGSPTIANDGTVLIGSADGTLYSINPGAQSAWPALNSANDPAKYNWKQNVGIIWSTPTIDYDYATDPDPAFRPWYATGSPVIIIGSTQYSSQLATKKGEDNGTCPKVYEEDPTKLVDSTFYVFDLATGNPLAYGFRTAQAQGTAGIYGSISMQPGGNYIVPTEGERVHVGYIGVDFVGTTAPCELIPFTEASFGTASGSGLVYGTPTVLPEGSFFIGQGDVFFRILPSLSAYLSYTAEGQIESSAAADGNFNVYFGCNGGVFYCLNSNSPDQPLRWRYPETGNITKLNGDAAEIISSPAIDNDIKHSIYFGASDGAMYAFYDGASISGKVTTAVGANPLASVEISLKDTADIIILTTATDTAGNFEFSGISSGQYTVVAKKDGYIFNPTLFPVTLANVDVLNVNFTAATAFTLTGRVVRTSDSQGMEGVSIGFVTRNSSGIIVYTDNSTVTDADGNYTISNVGYGTSTITPSLAGWGFDPAVRTITFTNGDDGGTPVELDDFAGTLGYQVSGKVIDATKALDDPDNGLADVTVTITNSTFTDTRTTNPQGVYSFTGLSNGTYIVKPARALYKFSPTNRTVVIEDASVLDQNFYGATGSTISGTLKLSGDENSFDGFVVNLYRDDETFWSRIFNRNKPRILVATVAVRDQGSFIFMGVAAGKYIVEPAKDGYSFNPASQKVTMTGLNDVGSLVFTAIGGFSISGKTNNLIGIGESGIGLTLVNDITGDTNEAISGLDGSYTFTGLESGSFTIIPEQTEFSTVSPASKNVIVTTGSVRKVNFTVYSLCTKTFITIPFWGTTDSTVNIIGSFFGTTPSPDDTSTVNVTLYDGTTTSVIAGVYFGTNDPATWVKATVDSWSPVYITAKVPVFAQRVVRVWVIRPGLSTCITNSPSNFFINTNQ